jgi:S-adenosyl-L-methionine hydrolase (adenosine-forming)
VIARPIITLTTDFGLSDHFVGAMKGVILGIQPAAQLIDISHGVQPYDIADGAFTIAQAYRYFPKKTIHVVVVDPGVGSARRPLLAEVAGQYFVAPDNGALSMVFAREPAVRVRHITNERYFLHPVSRTFHGRDVFSPVAGHLAAGVSPAQFGMPIKDYIRASFDEPKKSATPTHTGTHAWTGTILKSDHFGNLATNFHVDQFPSIRTHTFALKVGLQVITRLALTFSECEAGELFVVVGSSGYLEVAASQGSAAQALGCGAGSPVDLTIY